MRRLLAALALPVFLAGCGAEPVWAPDELVSRALHTTGDEPSLTLYTVIRVTGGEGAHSALMVDNDHRAIFDPAGSWRHSAAPERNDVHYGMTRQMLRLYVDYHARDSYYVVEQRVPVSAEVAAMAMREIEAYGAVPKAMCAVSVSSILARLPGFEDTSRTYFPANLMRDFGRRPGVTERVITDEALNGAAAEPAAL
jgi:hypothetical protein